MRLPLSYLDQMVAKGIDGTDVELDGEQIELQVRPFPQARNGIPNPAYDGGKGFTPGRRGEHQPGRGGRSVPGKQQLRADLPGPGQVQRRPRPWRRRWNAEASTCSPRPSAPG